MTYLDCPPECELSAGDIVWLQEDGGVRCQFCHEADMDDDPCDLREHGTAYRLTSILGDCIVLETLSKEAIS